VKTKNLVDDYLNKETGKMEFFVTKIIQFLMHTTAEVANENETFFM